MNRTEILMSAAIHQRFADEIAALDPGAVVCGIDGDEVRPEPIAPRVLLKTADVSGACVAKLVAGHPSIEWIQVSSAGVENMLPHLPGYHGVLTNGTGVHAEAVSEWVITMMLARARRLDEVLAHSAAGRWRPEVCQDVAGRTLGVIGAGRIGRAVAARAAALQMHVVGVRRSGVPVRGFTAMYDAGGLDRVLAASDYVLVSTPLTGQTRGLIGERAFGLMPPHATLMNVGRGAVVDTPALVRALGTGEIAGAVLDVTDPEPLPAGHPLWTMPNVLITAHSAWRSADGLRRVIDLFCANYHRWAAGLGMHNLVDLLREY